MDALSEFFEITKQQMKAPGNFLGLLHILIGRRITKTDGTVVSTGFTWRDLAIWLKKVRWDPDQVRELGIDPDDLHPRDRQRYWYSAITRAGVDSPAAHEAATRMAHLLANQGYVVSGQ